MKLYMIKTDTRCFISTCNPEKWEIVMLKVMN